MWGSFGLHQGTVRMGGRWGGLKAGEFDSVQAERKLVWIEGDAVTSANVKPIDSLVEAISQGVCLEEGVIDDFGLVRHV